MIVAQFSKPNEAVMRVEQIKNYHEVYFSVLRKLVDMGDLDGHITIKLDAEKDNVLPVAPEPDGKQLRLKFAIGNAPEHRERLVLQAAYLVDDPANFDMEFFMLYSPIMTGVRDGVTSKWWLAGLRVYPDHIECGYTNGERLNVVCLRNLTKSLIVEVVNVDGHAREALEIVPVPSGVLDNLPEDRYHPTIGDMRGYKVRRIDSVEAPASWESLSVVRRVTGLGDTYLLERHWTLNYSDNEQIRRQIVSDQEGCIAYRF